MSGKHKYNRMVNQALNTSNSKQDISNKTKIPIKILDQVYDRGIQAHSTLSAAKKKKIPAQAYAMGRVYNFAYHFKQGGLEFDQDLATKARKAIAYTRDKTNI